MSLTLKIILGMVLGLITGSVINFLSLNNNFYINTYFIEGVFEVIGSIFISSLKLMVVPLVFFSLSTGVASFDKEKKISLIALKTLSLYLFTTALAISLGLLIAIFFAVPWQVVLFLTGMMVVMKQWTNVINLFILLIPLSVGLYWFWFRHLSDEVKIES